MADRNVVGSNTFEQFRVEFNELATDVGDIASITGASGIIASATDVIEAVVSINTSVGNELDLPDSSGASVGRIKLGDSDDLQIYHNGSDSIIEDVGTGVLKVKTDGAGDSGTFAVDLDTQSLTIAGTTNEIETVASGQTLTIGLPNNVSISGNATIGGNITNGSVNLTFPSVGGAISTEGFSIALATALG